MDNASAPPSLRPGALVWYEARPGVSFAALVHSEPQPSGGGWVVSLEGLGDDYATWAGSGDRRTVAAVSTSALTPREEATP